jgi:hypothetical protein
MLQGAFVFARYVCSTSNESASCGHADSPRRSSPSGVFFTDLNDD